MGRTATRNEETTLLLWVPCTETAKLFLSSLQHPHTTSKAVSCKKSIFFGWCWCQTEVDLWDWLSPLPTAQKNSPFPSIPLSHLPLQALLGFTDSCGNHIPCSNSLLLLVTYCPLNSWHQEADKELGPNLVMLLKKRLEKQAAHQSWQCSQSPSN